MRIAKGEIVFEDVVQVFVWLCALGAAVAIPMSVRKNRVLMLGWVLFYSLTYWHLSCNGHYANESISGTKRWMPQHCERIVHRGAREVPKLNAMGAFFSPLVLADRLILHPNKDPREATSVTVGAQ